MATDVQLADYPLMSPRSLRGEWRMEQETQGPSQWSPQRVRGQHALLSTSRVHLYSKRTPFSQGHREKGMQTAISPKAELKLEKKSGHKPRSPRDSGPQKELVIPGIVDFERIRRALRTPKPQTPGTYCFGRLSHHSFFSRHHPHPQHVTHIQDLTGKPVCVVRDFPAPLPESTVFSGCQMGIPTISVPIGDPQSNRNPQLSSAWKKELKELASRVAFLTKEDELKKKEDTTSLNWNCKSRRPQAPGLSGTDLGAAELGIKKEQKEEPLREQGAKYSAETGRLIPASTRAVGRRRSHQAQPSQSSSRHEGVQAFLLQDQELLVLELLCQILETDSLSAIQFWLLYAPPKEKDLALGLLQTAVAQLLPQPLVSIPTEKLLNQLQEVHEPPQEKQEPPCSQSPKKTKISPFTKSEKPEYIGEAQVLRMHSSQNAEEKTSKPRAES
ncbi:protein TBATA isoform X6 [Pan troglodytes]|uniref:protein TBATA isoform X6 n=2 Tax=Pan troglodytes TaxID=9598 RepID=UPI0023F3F706|nr:protein TBATA isoform X8 [Pan troglodytes]XP_054515437.1 protein TBATA isoform X8 [Pan troglodytes]